MAKDAPGDAGKPKEDPLFIQVWSEYHKANDKPSDSDGDNQGSDGHFEA